MNKNILIYDCDFISSGKYAPTTYKLSSYYKQMHDSVSIVDNIEFLSYDKLYIVRDNINAKLPDINLLDLGTPIGTAMDMFGDTEELSMVMQSVRPDYSINKGNFNLNDRNQYVQLVSNGKPILKRQNFSNVYRGDKVTIVTDTDLWSQEESTIVAALKTILKVHHVVFDSPISLERVMHSAAIYDVFTKIHFANKGKRRNRFYNDYGIEYEQIIEILQFFTKFKQYKKFRPLEIKIFTQPITNRDTFERVYVKNIKIMYEARALKHRILLTMPKIKLNNYKDQLRGFYVWSRNFYRKKYLDIPPRYIDTELIEKHNLLQYISNEWGER